MFCFFCVVGSYASWRESEVETKRFERCMIIRRAAFGCDVIHGVHGLWFARLCDFQL